MAKIESINVSDGGVPKAPVESARITRNGVEGDRQEDLTVHGGPDRAVSLYALELIEALQAEGHPVFPGALGENLTLSGLDWGDIESGARLVLGNGEDGVEIEIVRHAAPCHKIEPFFSDRRSKRVSHKVNPGWSRFYARVLKEGVVRVGDAVNQR